MLTSSVEEISSKIINFFKKAWGFGREGFGRDRFNKTIITKYVSTNFVIIEIDVSTNFDNNCFVQKQVLLTKVSKSVKDWNLK